jgi:hypothetical protein
VKLLCPDGKHEVKVRFNPAPGERFCPEHGCSLVKPPKSMRGQSQREGLPGEKAARGRFRSVVTQRPCFFLDRDEMGERRRPDHSCTYPLDAHHLLPKGWLRRELDLPPEDLVAVMWNPIIGAPLCRAAHEAVERGVAYIYRDELEPDLVAFCERFDTQNPGQRSLLERLFLECPEREVAA